MVNALSVFALDLGEHMVLKFRKHWFIFLRDSLGTALGIFLPPGAIALASALGFDVFSALPPSLITFIYFWWLLVVWLSLAVIWTNYYLDLWVITDKRIVSVDQTGLFSRAVTTFPFANIQDVTVEQRGIIATFLDFGSVTVQTAGPTTNNMVIVGVTRPGVVRDTIVHEAEGWRKRNGVIQSRK